MEYKDYFKRESVIGKIKNSPKDLNIDSSELRAGEKDEMEHTEDPKLASIISKHHLKDDPHYYSKLKNAGLEEDVEEHCGACEDDLSNAAEGSDFLPDVADDYDDNGGLPKSGGALAVPHLGQPIMMGKIINVGGIGGGPASGEQSGMTAIGVSKDKGGIPVKQQNDTETLTAGGKKVDSSIASKSVGGSVVPGEGQSQGGLNTKGTISATAKLTESKNKVRKAVKNVLKEIRFNKETGKWVKINETVDMKMGPSYKTVQPRQYKVIDDDTARTNQYEPEITEMCDEEEETKMNERYVKLANEQRNLSSDELTEMKSLREKIDRLSQEDNIDDINPTKGNPHEYKVHEPSKKVDNYTGEPVDVDEACEDYPCCGHEAGQCPTQDEHGNNVYRCVCGAKLPPNSRSSLCQGCLSRGNDDEDGYDDRGDDLDEAGGQSVQHKSFRTANDAPQNPKIRWNDEVNEGKSKQSKVTKSIQKGMKANKTQKNPHLKHQKPKKTTSGVHKRKT